jgi:hypothetical protein
VSYNTSHAEEGRETKSFKLIAQPTVKPTSINLYSPSSSQFKIGDPVDIGATITKGSQFLRYNVYVKNSKGTAVYTKEQNTGDKFWYTLVTKNLAADTYTVSLVSYNTSHAEEGRETKSFKLIAQPTVKPTSINLYSPSSPQFKIGDPVDIGATITKGSQFMRYNVYIKNSKGTAVYTKEQNTGDKFWYTLVTKNLAADTYTISLVSYNTSHAEEVRETKSFKLISSKYTKYNNTLVPKLNPTVQNENSPINIPNNGGLWYNNLGEYVLFLPKELATDLYLNVYAPDVNLPKDIATAVLKEAIGNAIDLPYSIFLSIVEFAVDISDKNKQSEFHKSVTSVRSSGGFVCIKIVSQGNRFSSTNLSYSQIYSPFNAGKSYKKGWFFDMSQLTGEDIESLLNNGYVPRIKNNGLYKYTELHTAAPTTGSNAISTQSITTSNSNIPTVVVEDYS